VRPVIRAARLALAHVPDLVLSGSKPRRELAVAPELCPAIRAHLRPFDAAVTYPPHQVMLGNLSPESLREIARPWHLQPLKESRSEGPAGFLVDERTFYGWLARADTANLILWNTRFVPQIEPELRSTQIKMAPSDSVARMLTAGGEALFGGGESEPVGVVLPAQPQDDSLAAPVLLENLAAKATGAMALHHLLKEGGGDEAVDFLLGCGEEAVGDRYQRGGGNLAKAMGELAEVRTAGGVDIKAFCAAPVHGLILAGALVASGLYRRVVVVGGGSLAKLGMKFRGHLAADYPILEDVLVGIAVEVAPDDGRSPVLRLESTTVLRIADGVAPHHVAAALTLAPLQRHGLRLQDVDRFAVELHNPDITEPAGSGDVPATNYRMISALAAKAGEISREEMPGFERAH